MKIGKLEITEGPNMGWVLFTAILFVPALSYGNWWPIAIWAIFNVIAVGVAYAALLWHERKKRPRPLTDDELDAWHDRNIKDGL